MKIRIMIALTVAGLLATLLAPIAVAQEPEGGNVVGFPASGSSICLDATDGSMVNNCHSQYPLRPYEPIKFDGLHPGLYIARSGGFSAFVFVRPGQDNIIDWAYTVPLSWTAGLPVPPPPVYHMWHPGVVTYAPPPPVTVSVDQSVVGTGSISGTQTVDVNSPIPAVVHVRNQIDPPIGGSSSGSVRATASPGSSSRCISYTVSRGDNLSRIAARYGVSWSTIARLNRLVNPNRIFVGQRLTICR